MRVLGNTIPSSLDSDEEYIYALRHHLGLKPHDDLIACACGVLLEVDPAHFHSCQSLKTAVTIRHNRLVTKIAKAFRGAGAYVQVEYCPFGEKRTRPDLTVILP